MSSASGAGKLKTSSPAYCSPVTAYRKVSRCHVIFRAVDWGGSVGALELERPRVGLGHVSGGRVPSLEYPWSPGFDPQQDNPVKWRKEDQELSSAVLQVGGQPGLHETLFGVGEKKEALVYLMSYPGPMTKPYLT